jgi:hypothetical protein
MVGSRLVLTLVNFMLMVLVSGDSMNDKQMIAIAKEVDNFAESLSHKYEITALNLSAVLIARAMVFNKQAGSDDEFLRLLLTVAQDPPLTKHDARVH